jgi:hypothetical protein
VSADTARRIEVEFALIERLLADHAALATEVALRPPHAWERSALAAMLHAYYNGVENAFKILAPGRAGAPTSADWHAALLASMAAPSGVLPPVIDDSLASSLAEYMRFRHFFRHAYVFDLNWEKMKPLIEGLAAVHGRLCEQIRAYLAAAPGD